MIFICWLIQRPCNRQAPHLSFCRYSRYICLCLYVYINIYIYIECCWVTPLQPMVPPPWCGMTAKAGKSDTWICSGPGGCSGHDHGIFVEDDSRWQFRFLFAKFGGVVNLDWAMPSVSLTRRARDKPPASHDSKIG